MSELHKFLLMACLRGMVVRLTDASAGSILQRRAANTETEGLPPRCMNCWVRWRRRLC